MRGNVSIVSPTFLVTLFLIPLLFAPEITKAKTPTELPKKFFSEQTQQGAISVEFIPDVLKEWIPWVLDDVEHYGCTPLNDEFICTWPSTLALQLTETGGRFSQTVSVDRKRFFHLPGSMAHWPHDVRANNTPVAILEKNGRPTIELNPGRYSLEGKLTWSQLPEGLDVPSDYALISLEINGAQTPFVQRDANGRLWLKKSTKQSQSEDKLTLEVFRKISDGIPMMVTTTIVVRSAGKTTEVTLNNVQLSGTLPMSVDSQLPARLGADGELKLQTRGGTFNVDIVSIVKNAPEQFTSLERPAPWPQKEMWVLEPNEEIRQIEVKGVTGIDPQRTSIKEEWKHLSAYTVAPNDTLTIRTTRKGESHPPPDKITLHRKLWLDMDGAGFTIADALQGSLHRSTRMDMAQDAALGHVEVNGTGQVVTTNPKTKQAGVELRQNHFEMHAESRIEQRPSHLRAVGWSTNVQKLNASLFLPPGWDLITASGVDNIPGTWWDSWSLFGFFFVLLASIATGKLTRWYYGILTLVTLVLLHKETDVEILVIIGLPLLISMALLQALPKNKFRIGVIVAWSVFALVLISTSIPFSVDQIRQGLYPQLENEYYQPSDVAPNANEYSAPKSPKYEKEMLAGTPTAPPEPMQQEAAINEENDIQLPEVQDDNSNVQRHPLPKKKLGKTDFRLESSAGSILGRGSNVQKAALQQDPQAVVQTGPGIPKWEWNEFSLYWQGPVSKDQKIKLYLTGPTTQLILAFARVLLLALLAVLLFLETFKSIKNPPANPPSLKQTGNKQAAIATGLLLMMWPQPSAANQPTQDRLNELRSKLTREAPCSPHCVDTSKLSIEVIDNSISMVATIHAGAETTWPIPGPASNWVPSEVTLNSQTNGKTEAALSLRSNGFIYLKIPKGIHSVALKGTIKNESAFTLEFGDVPHFGTVSADGYTVNGLRDDGRFETSILLSRLIQSDDTFQSNTDTTYTPWLKIDRKLDLGIPWLVHTTVTRVSPPGAPLMLRIPLLPGETVTDSNFEVKNEHVSVALGRDETSTSWASVLKETPVLHLVAPKGENWTETWHVKCSPIWQCHQSGIAPIHNSVKQKTYQPWPGEKLSIKTNRPKAQKGQTVTIDQAKLSVSPGLRLTETIMELQVRASQGGVQKISLPQNITIQSFSIDGDKRPFKQNDNTLEIALKTGQQNIVLEWQQQGGITTIFSSPVVLLGSDAANFKLKINMPTDRWLIGVSGPSWGPAVLFWGYLLTILVVSFLILGRAKFSHLKGWQWALLSLGLTQVPIGISIIIVAWFFLLSWRNTDPMKNQIWVWQNLLQVGIGIWTFIALISLLGAVYKGLAVQPDMQVAGLGSSNSNLNWYMDRIDGTTPSATVWSIPILIWKGIMLAWSLWLAYSLISWSKWGFASYTTGSIWRAPAPRKVTSAMGAPNAAQPPPQETDVHSTKRPTPQK